MGLHLMIREKIVLRLLFRLEWGVIILLIGLLPLFIITLLPNQQLDILQRVIHSGLPLTLKILILRNALTVPFQLTRRQ
jgi:hypothetical protein